MPTSHQCTTISQKSCNDVGLSHLIWYVTNAQIQIFLATLFSYIASVGDGGFQFFAKTIGANAVLSSSFYAVSAMFWVVSLLSSIYSAIFLYNMRRSLIQRFYIGESRLTSCLVTVFCFCCSTAQMARHVLHYDTDGGPGCCDPGPELETQEQTESLYGKGM